MRWSRASLRAVRLRPGRHSPQFDPDLAARAAARSARVPRSSLAGTIRSTYFPTAAAPDTPCPESTRRRACKSASAGPDRRSPASRGRPCRTAFAFRSGRRQAEEPRHGDAMRQRADVVAAEGRPQEPLVLKHEPRLPLEIRVGLPLVLINGDRPAVGSGVDRLVIPIGPFDQPHPNRRAAGLRPLGQRDKIAPRIAQIALDHDADVGPVAEFVFRQHRLEKCAASGPWLRTTPCRCARARCAVAPRGATSATARRRGGRPVAVDRIELAIERRKLDRDIHPRQRPTLVAIDAAISGQELTVGAMPSIRSR